MSLDSMDNYINDQERRQEEAELDGFISDDGAHQVSWELAEIAPNLEYETWWCKTHDKMYYGGCIK